MAKTTKNGSPAKPRTTPNTAAAQATGDFRVNVQYEPRILTEHFGRDKYPSTSRAASELVANGFDAAATLVDVDISVNPLNAIDAITVYDNGHGMTRAELTERFGLVGVRSEPGKKIGRFGVGRLAVFRLGRASRWRTVAIAGDGHKHRLSFTLDEKSAEAFSVQDETVVQDEPTGTWIQVTQLYEPEYLREGRILWDLAVQLCGYLLANPSKNLRVNQKPVLIDVLLASRITEHIPGDDSAGIPPATLTHLNLKSSLARDKFPAHLLLTAQGLTVQAITLPEPPSPTYVGLAESPYFDEMVTANRAAFHEMDQTFGTIRDSILSRVSSYGALLREQQDESFIDRARQKPYYPYKTVPADAIEALHQQVYDATLEALHRVSNLELMKSQHQQIVFRLLERALSNGDLLHVLSQVGTLSDADMTKFRELLERTTMQALLDLASQVQGRLDFLQMLRELVYTPIAERVRERAQLHKYLENNTWIFGPQYHLATSDKAFRTVIATHREQAGLEPVGEDLLSVIVGVDQIPDLFLAVRKDYPTSGGHRRNLLVELKRPTVEIGFDERTQLEKYANVVESSGAFSIDTKFDLFVVSSSIRTELRRSVEQTHLPPGCFQQTDRTRLWARTWGDIIDAAEAELHFVKEQLRLKSAEMSVPDYFGRVFPHVGRKLTDVTLA